MGGRRGAAGADYSCDHANVTDGFRCWRRRFRAVHRGQQCGTGAERELRELRG